MIAAMSSYQKNVNVYIAIKDTNLGSRSTDDMSSTCSLNLGTVAALGFYHPCASLVHHICYPTIISEMQLLPMFSSQPKYESLQCLAKPARLHKVSSCQHIFNPIHVNHSKYTMGEQSPKVCLGECACAGQRLAQTIRERQLLAVEAIHVMLEPAVAAKNSLAVDGR